MALETLLATGLILVGASPGGTASTILDVTGSAPRILREGPVDLETIHRFNNTVEPFGA